MAKPDFTGLDGRLRDALGQAAAPGDSAGVADAIRSRVAAGDTGTSVASPTAPGWAGGVRSWLPWLALLVVGAVGGTALGLSGALGAPVAPPASEVAIVTGSAPAASCPGGPIVDEFHRGDRLLVVQRSAESDFYGVRDPRDLGTVLWLPASALTRDADAATLPVGACPAVVVSTPTPTPTPTATPAPTPEPTPEPGDDTDPVIQQAASSTSPVFVMNNGTATLSAVVSDDTAVTYVSISWSGSTSGSAAMQFSGGAWTFVFDPPQDTPAGTVTFTIQAQDAAGNLSAPATVNVQTVP